MFKFNKKDKIRFWPSIKHNKMNQDYSNVLYTKEVDYHDLIQQEYFYTIENFLTNKLDQNYTHLLQHGISNVWNKDKVEYIWNDNFNKWVFVDDTCNEKMLNPREVNEKLSIDFYVSFYGTQMNMNKYRKTRSDLFLPEVPATMFESKSDETLEITINVKEFQKIYPYLTLQNVNYFLSDFEGLGQKSTQSNDNELEGMKWSYWFVSGSKSYYDSKGNIQRIKYELKLDIWSTYYYQIWNHKGFIHLKRHTLDRWHEDNLFTKIENVEGEVKPSNIIPNFQDNMFLGNCNISCQNLNQKIQKYTSTPLFSSYHYDPKGEGTGKEKTQMIEWNDTNDVNKGVKYKRWATCFWTTQSKVNEDYTGEHTSIDGYSLPLNLYVFVANTPNGIPKVDEISKIASQLKTLKEKPQYVKYVTMINEAFDISKWKVFDGITGVDGITYAPKEVETWKDEYYYFKDRSDKLNKQIIVRPADIVNTELVNYEFEPHCYTNNHFSTRIGVFNKGSLEFDITTLLNLNNKDDFDKIEYTPSSKSFKLMKKRTTFSPELNMVYFYLLDNDTAVSYKRDTGVLTISSSTSYNMPYYDNTYIDFLKQTEASKQAGIDNIATQKEMAKRNAGQQFGMSGINGLLGGAASGAMAGGPIGALVGGLAGGIGGLAGGGWQYSNALKNATAQETMALRGINATYEDAKTKPANISTGSPKSTQLDLFMANYADDDDNYAGYRSIDVPQITFLQVKDHDMRVIALMCNKFGYPIDTMKNIDSFQDLMIRAFWNVASIVNMSEILKSNSVPDKFAAPIIEQSASEYGIRFWNLEYFNGSKYSEIYNYEKNNFEENLTGAILNLQEKVVG